MPSIFVHAIPREYSFESANFRLYYSTEEKVFKTFREVNALVKSGESDGTMPRDPFPSKVLRIDVYDSNLEASFLFSLQAGLFPKGTIPDPRKISDKIAGAIEFSLIRICRIDDSLCILRGEGEDLTPARSSENLVDFCEAMMNELKTRIIAALVTPADPDVSDDRKE